VNREADESENQLRLSVDTKATVKIGEFSRVRLHIVGMGSWRVGWNSLRVELSPHPGPSGRPSPHRRERSYWFRTGGEGAERRRNLSRPSPPPPAAKTHLWAQP